MEYVSPHYQERLDALAETLITARKFGQATLQLEGIQLEIEFAEPTEEQADGADPAA